MSTANNFPHESYTKPAPIAATLLPLFTLSIFAINHGRIFMHTLLIISLFE